MTKDDIYAWLMGGLDSARHFDSHLFACVLAARCAGRPESLYDSMGIEAGDLRRLMERHFPAVAAQWPPEQCLKCWLNGVEGQCRCHSESAVSERADEEADVYALLLEHRAAEHEEERWLARIVARSALEGNHLWEDVGVRNRSDVSALIARHFPGLAALNTGNMRWKRFLYKQLCDRAEVNLCKAPNCRVCAEYPVCFGPEEPGKASGGAAA